MNQISDAQAFLSFLFSRWILGVFIIAFYFWVKSLVDKSVKKMIDKKELKPCPFCGSEVEIKWNWLNRPDDTKTYSIYGHKQDCLLKGMQFNYYRKQDLTIAWNRRVK